MLTLLQRVARRANLNKAWNSIKHRADSKGFDLETISEFRTQLDANLKLIRTELLEGRYNFTKLRGHAIAKGGQKIRPLRIPAVRDRVVQKAIQLVIEKRLNHVYKIDNTVSYAYIKEKSVWDAIKQVRDLHRKGFNWVYVADIQNFFGTIDPKKLLQEYIFKTLSDNSLDDLITRALNTEVGNYEKLEKLGFGQEFISDESGIAQGGILSPLFANVYLNELDRAMIRNRLRMVRYADDFVVMCKSEGEAIKANKLAKEILENKLGLTLHDLDSKKSEIKRFTHLDFLGVRFESDSIYPGTRAFKKMIASLKEAKVKSPKGNAIQDLVYLRERAQSWAATYFCTEINVEHYAAMEQHLVAALKALMKRYGFTTRKQNFTSIELRKIGISNFRTRMLAMKKSKRKEILVFDQ